MTKVFIKFKSTVGDSKCQWYGDEKNCAAEHHDKIKITIKLFPL